MNRKNLAVPVSGTGSLLEAMIRDKLDIALVLADRPCRGLEIAEKAKIPTMLIERTDFTKSFDREKYTLEIVKMLEDWFIDLVAMAGFMTVFHRVIFERGFRGRILNIHPALLPAFKGPHVVRDALEFGVKITGTSVHVATEELDAGEILAQEAVRVLPGDTEATLHERIKVVERELYPRAIRAFLKTL